MLKKMVTVLAGAVLTVSVSANVQAASVTVEKGDTLWGISRANNTSVENIKIWNDLTTDIIHPGDVLTVSQEKEYTVQKGDTLWGIAIDHQVTVSQIKDWNDLHTDLIHPGLKLSIHDGVTAKSEKPKQSAPVQEKKVTSEVQSTSTTNNSAKEIMMEATAYTASCKGCSGITATGINLIENPNLKVISVDPSVIPLGSKVYVEGYGEAIAGDTGGSIKGKKIDVFIPSKQDAINFGRKQVKVRIID